MLLLNCLVYEKRNVESKPKKINFTCLKKQLIQYYYEDC